MKYLSNQVEVCSVELTHQLELRFIQVVCADFNVSTLQLSVDGMTNLQFNSIQNNKCERSLGLRSGPAEGSQAEGLFGSLSVWKQFLDNWDFQTSDCKEVEEKQNGKT